MSRRRSQPGATPLWIGRSDSGSVQLHVIQADAAYAGWTFAVVSVDPGLLDDTIERVNITLPRRVLKRLDALARAAGKTRSGFIAQLTLEKHPRQG